MSKNSTDKLLKLFDVYNDYLLESLISNPKLQSAITEMVDKEVKLRMCDVGGETIADPSQLIGIDEVAKLLNMEINTAKVNITRHPETLPPRIKIPGTRLVRFMLKDVRDWIEKHRER
jgi:predicted DNA-binding transcriptional regulator AlpA